MIAQLRKGRWLKGTSGDASARPLGAFPLPLDDAKSRSGAFRIPPAKPLRWR
jgi:hypothetical protein